MSELKLLCLITFTVILLYLLVLQYYTLVFIHSVKGKIAKNCFENYFSIKRKYFPLALLRS